MRLLALIGLVGLLSGCGSEVEEETATTRSGSPEATQMGPSESWCHSYTNQQVCPKYICAWYSSPAPAHCGLPAASVVGSPETSQPEAAQPETTQMGPPESWCRSYTSKTYCPSVCAWYSSPAPGYCSVKATQ
jgi:hypothetical protein